MGCPPLDEMKMVVVSAGGRWLPQIPKVRVPEIFPPQSGRMFADYLRTYAVEGCVCALAQVGSQMVDFLFGLQSVDRYVRVAPTAWKFLGKWFVPDSEELRVLL